MKKKLLALLLAMVLALSLLVFQASAVEEDLQLAAETTPNVEPLEPPLEEVTTVGSTRAELMWLLWRVAGAPDYSHVSSNFTDVSPSDYYYSAVMWAVQEQITNGTSDTTFSPNDICNRAQVVTFIWRLNKCPVVVTANPFVDVNLGEYYSNAVLWFIHENGGEYTDLNFYPNVISDIISYDPQTDIWTLPLPSSPFGFSVADGKATLVVYNEELAESTDVVIPETYHKFPVAAIADNAFNGRNITSVTIPYGVTSIGDRAFQDCTSLASVNIPDSVTSMGDSVFYNCSSLTGVTIPSGVNAIGDGAFQNCASLTDVVIPDGVSQIGSSLFGGCSSLRSVSIPESVTEIGGSAFYQCSSLTTVTIPSGITRIGHWAFYQCSGLTKIILPDSVAEIGNYAFKSCSGIGNVVIPAGMTRIEVGVFQDCYNLRTVKIPSSVTYIGEIAFDGTRVRTVEYDGSAEMWEDVIIKYGNDRLYRANVICAPLSITTQPKDYTGKLNSTASFTVAAVGEGLTYQWQVSDDNGKTWSNSSVKTAKYSTKLTAARDGRQVRCIVTDAEGSKATSNVATMTLQSTGVTITTQPKDFNGKLNSTASFTVVATGDGLTYQWQISDDGENWTNSSVKTAKYSTKLTAAKNGRQVRCIVTDENGNSLTSEAATMKLSSPAITTQPKDYVGKVNTTASFAVTASGNGLTYQWQVSDDGKTWSNSSVKAAKYTTKLTAARDGRMVRCIVTDANGNSVTSSAASMNIG